MSAKSYRRILWFYKTYCRFNRLKQFLYILYLTIYRNDRQEKQDSHRSFTTLKPKVNKEALLGKTRTRIPKDDI